MAGRAAGAESPRAIAVERLGPGDHACLPFDTPGHRWAVRADFAATGLARGERVMLFVGQDTEVPHALEQLTAHGVPARQAAAEGRLAVLRDSPGYDPVHGFDATARTGYWAAAADDASTRGFTGLRAAGDMAWAAGPAVEPAELLSYEREITPLFAKLGFTSLCEYDRLTFPTDRLDPLLDVHPLSVVAAPGTLHAVREGNVLRLAGDADLATRTAFELAVREPGLTAIDLTGLAFLDAHCARELVRTGGRGEPTGRDDRSDVELVLECTATQARLLQICGMRQQPGSPVIRLSEPGNGSA
jgi:MEDS: MEthanogen/methylotroph, DcmR Sensory domain